MVLAGPFGGPENHSRDSTENLWSESDEVALRPLVRHHAARRSLGQGRRKPAQRTLEAGFALPYPERTGRSALPQDNAGWQKRLACDHPARYAAFVGCSG